MRRTKQWWAQLAEDERAYLVYLERAAGKYYGMGGYLPDDCSECSACSQPMLGSGLCPHCCNELETLRAAPEQRMAERIV